MRTHIIIIAIAAIPFFPSCKKDKTTTPVVLAAQTTLNVSYGTDALQKMDVYLPARRSKDTTKVIIFIHGGAWSSGDKADLTTGIDSLKKYCPWYAFINLNYRLANGTTNLFPTQENDIKAAMEYIAANLEQYQISNKMAFIGFSAGAHLSLLQGYKYSSPIKVKAIADFFGPTDMAAMYTNPASAAVPSILIAALMGGTPASNPSIYQQSSPINFVTSTSPATIIFQGGVDYLVNPSQSETLKTKLSSLGVPNQYVFYPTLGHGWSGADMDDSFIKLIAFFNLYLK